jgi:hypothetical protein
MSELNEPTIPTAKAAQAIGYRVDLDSSLCITTSNLGMKFALPTSISLFSSKEDDMRPCLANGRCPSRTDLSYDFAFRLTHVGPTGSRRYAKEELGTDIGTA